MRSYNFRTKRLITANIYSPGVLDVDGVGNVTIDSEASITMGAAMANGQTLKLGPNGATEMVFTPHGTGGSETISLINTAGTASDAIKLETTAAGGINLNTTNTNLTSSTNTDLTVKSTNASNGEVYLTMISDNGADKGDGVRFKYVNGVLTIATDHNTKGTYGETLVTLTGHDADNTRTTAITGSLTVTQDITAYSSDIRLKENIQKIENAISKVCSLNGFTYNWNELAEKEMGFNKDQRLLGVSAQEVQNVLPEAVKAAPANPNYLTVQYEKLVPLLIESTKEQQKQIEELRNEVELLKKNNKII